VVNRLLVASARAPRNLLSRLVVSLHDENENGAPRGPVLAFRRQLGLRKRCRAGDGGYGWGALERSITDLALMSIVVATVTATKCGEESVE